ncbi:pirin family protein [Cytobacillus firmus]|uniref:pirin family protein n=1 Tax=Cytobacillus firmus TaxID=1399 RepID=UPI0021C687C8|nr:pirin family protein [Cytobacillus firmus]MCU1806643.1 pirin family protein [Cytobacillus firmus]
MQNEKIPKREIASIRKVKLQKHSPIHAAGPVIEPGNWEKYDPFLLMMEDKFQKGAFDVHPHRGIETVTYVIEGAIEHYDSHSGEGGVLGPGDVQWMTAGSGVVHNEVPSEGITAHSLQLWINLPREKKMTAPRYQNLKGSEVPVREEEGAVFKVFSGSSRGVVSPTLNHVPVTMVEVRMEKGAAASQELPGSYKGFIYIIEGSGIFGENKVHGANGQALELGDGGNGESEIAVKAEEPLRFLLYAGEPVKEQVVARGPFVMNTEEEIRTAYKEYMNGTFLK